MLKFIPVLISVLFSINAIASEPEKVLTDELVMQVKKACMTQEYEGSDETKLVSRLQCMNGIDIKSLKQRQKAGDKKLDAVLLKMEAQAAMFEQLIRAQTEATKVAAEQAKKTVSNQRPVGMPAGGPALMPAPYAVLDAPGQYLGATWEMTEMKSSRIKIEYISTVLGYKFYLNNVAARVVVKKNGQLLAIAHPGQPNGMPQFNAFYADLDGDGQPDTTSMNGQGAPILFRGTDALNDNVYVTYKPGDYLEIFFLVDSGKVLATANGAQQMWKTLAAYKLQPPNATPGHWDMTPYLGPRIR